jgi:hypothetical protein
MNNYERKDQTSIFDIFLFNVFRRLLPNSIAVTNSFCDIYKFGKKEKVSRVKRMLKEKLPKVLSEQLQRTSFANER